MQVGEGGGDRTHDPRIKSPLLYQLSYAPKSRRGVVPDARRMVKASDA